MFIILGTGVNCSLNVWWIYLWRKPLVLDPLLVILLLLLLIQSHYWQLACSSFLFLPGLVLGEYTFLRICTFFHFSHFTGILLFEIISYDPLNLYGVGCSFSFYIYEFIDLGSLFFLMSLAKGLSVSFIFLKESPLSFISLFNFLASISITHTLILIISLLLLTLGFISSVF